MKLLKQLPYATAIYPNNINFLITKFFEFFIKFSQLHSTRKCMYISRENLYVDIDGYGVKLHNTVISLATDT